MSIETLLALLVIGLVTGTLIGAVGVGGVLLVPALVLIAGLGVEEATPIATLSFLFTGLAATIAYQRQGRIQWDTARWLIVAAVPGAVLGAVTNVALPGRAITIVIAALLAAAFVQTIRTTHSGESAGRTISVVSLLAIGAFVGFGSALTGTGGPVLLVPVMLLAGSAVGLAVASSQPIQIPIAVFGAATFAASGVLDWQLAIALGVAQGIGAVGGARLSNRLPLLTLRTLVSWALAVSAVLFIVKAVAG